MREIVRCFVPNSGSSGTAGPDADLGPGLVRDELELTVDEEEVRILVVYVGEQGCDYKMSYRVRCRGAAKVEIRVAGVLAEGARKELTMGIEFLPGCGEARGTEKEEVLVMDGLETRAVGPGAGLETLNKTCPEMRCGDRRARGRHGVSVGRLDVRVMAFLASRGLSEPQARNLMVWSRLFSVVNRITDEVEREKVRGEVERAIKRLAA